MNGMRFASKNTLNGHAVHFQLSGSALKIRTVKERKLYEYIPHDALADDFPRDFVEDFAHWLVLDRDSGELSIEWRNLADPWAQKPQWVLGRNSDGSWIMKKSDSAAVLIDWHSRTSQHIFNILAPIENARNIHIQYNDSSERLLVNLPRFKIEFFLSASQLDKGLECRQFRHMVVDKDQSFGAMTGLLNRLVLRNVKDDSRLVIIPHGDVNFKLNEQHPIVRIATDDEKKYRRLVNYHAYHIDPLLGRLVGNRSLKSDYFKAYLHALTSSCFPDTLTGRTGTEESLAYLRSEAARSFQNLDVEEAEVLQVIAELTPKRVWYPEHLSVMQMVKWADLPSLSQHNGFLTEVADIVAGAEKRNLFFETNALVALRQIPTLLLQRSSSKNSMLYSKECRVIGSEFKDAIYTARDRIDNRKKEADVCEIAHLAHSWETRLKTSSNFFNILKQWHGTFHGKVVDGLQLMRYQPELLKDYSSFLRDNWLGLQRALSTSTKAKDRYKIMFFLGTMAYSGTTNMEFLRSLLALATVDTLRSVTPPNGDSFDLHNAEFARDRIVGILESQRKKSHSVPPVYPYTLVERTSKMEDDDFEWQCDRAYEKLQNSAFLKVTDKLQDGWPNNYFSSVHHSSELKMPL
jgi:hypothetical protein